MIQFNLISIDAPRKFSNNAKLVGGKLFEKFIKMLGQHEISHEADYYLAEGQEDVKKIAYKNMSHTSQNTSQNSSDEDYKSPRKVSVYETVPFDIKLKIVMTADEHPHWSFRTLQQRFKKQLRHNSDLARFRKDVLSGGNFRDKLELIKKNIYDRFIEAKQNEQLVTRDIFQQWAIAAASQYHDNQEDNEGHKNIFHFVASKAWLTSFLRTHKISNRRIIRYIPKKEIISSKVVIESATYFQELIQAISPEYDPDFVINTYQTSCEYKMNTLQTDTHIGEKLIELNIGDLNKVFNFYTIQYSLTKSGKLLNKVFVCLKEFTDSFEVHVQKDVDDLLTLCRNIVVVCSKSGKLTTSLYQQYLKSVVKPYVGNNSFLFIVDFWEGQKNIQTYNEIFRDNSNKPMCNLQLISPECTLICQPSNIYFYRQVEIIIKKILNYSDLLIGEESIQSNTRTGAIRIQSLTHYLLSAPKFKCMLEYAWYTSKLVDDRDIFDSANQLCFPSNIHNTKCVCEQYNSFIKCSWCDKFLCFHCFYTNFHPQHCDTMRNFYNTGISVENILNL